MTRKHYDVVIVGSGPAGIFAALELAHDRKLDVLVLEKGKDLEERLLSAQALDRMGAGCPPEASADLVKGLGGAGAFSDGKLTLSPDVGGRLPEYTGPERAQELISYVAEVYRPFCTNQRVYGVGPEVERLRARAARAELRLIPVPLLHLGTDRCRVFLSSVRQYLRSRVEVRTGTEAVRILTANGRAAGVETTDGEAIACDYLVVAPGREGADWLRGEAQRLGLNLMLNPVDLGVRVEVPNAVMEDLTSVLYESKLEYYSKTFDDRVRTFCMCPAGEVTVETTGGADPVTTVNGHSYADRRTENTNFALLVSTTFTEPFKDPISYGKYIARLANMLGGGVLMQRLGDLLEGRRSTPERIHRGVIRPTLPSATPGDLSFALPYRFLKDITEMLQSMDQLTPGLASRHTILYGVEVKFYSSRLQLSETLETQVRNLFAIGDGAGVTRGLVQSSASGVHVAREVRRRMGRPLAPIPLAELMSPIATDSPRDQVPTPGVQ